jgi:hypothetical protein
MSGAYLLDVRIVNQNTLTGLDWTVGKIRKEMDIKALKF